MKKTYSNGEVTISWEPEICIHSTICWKEATGLPSVFNPFKRPWVEINGSETDNIIEQVKKCPSGALKFSDLRKENLQNKDTPPLSIKVKPNGPLLIEGSISITDVDGKSTVLTKAALCRCGASNKKPYFDGSHNKIGFQDTER